MSDLIKGIANLSPQKRELLVQKLRQVKDNTSQTKIRPHRDTNIFPLSFAQQRLWFLEQLEPENPFYNQSATVRLTGVLNLSVLEQSFNEIISRHEVLRTTFTMLDGQLVQVIAPTLVLKLPVIDLQKLSLAEQEKEVRRIATLEAQQPFNLSKGPLLRYVILRLEETEHVLLFTMHHIISDGWSKGVLIREIAALYEAFATGHLSPLPEIEIQYADFAVWQRQWLKGEVLEAQLAYWKKQLMGSPPILELPTDHPRPKVQTFSGKTQSLVLSKTLTEALKNLSNREKASLFMTLLAAFKTLFYRYTGQEDILVGTPIANRNRSEIEGLIGFFVNTLVMRTYLDGNPSFRELLSRVRKVAVEAYENQDLPFELLVEQLQPQRNLSYTPLFQVMFVLGNTPMPALKLPGLTVSLLETDSSTAKFDLTVSMTESEQGLIGNLEYNTDLFDTDTIIRMLGNFQTLLEGIVTNPDQSLLDLPLLTQAERQILAKWNDTQVEYPQSQCIHQLIESQVEHTPDAVAVVFEDQQLTYRELNARANQLAHYLRSLGVGPEVLVGICVERSLLMLIGLLGILKAGGAYVPLDPAYPQERLGFMLADAQIPVLLTQEKLVSTLPEHQAQVVCLDTDWMEIAQLSTFNPTNTVTTENLAYVIYTSGSTGQPKGVQIPHSAVVNFLSTMRQTPGLTQEDILLSVTTLSFDIAALEIYLPLIVGARLVLVSREVATDGIQLLEHLTNGATVMQATPATWRMLLAAGWQDKLPLKILCGGEALERSLANQLLELGTEVWNLYGPTETTIWSAVQKIESNKELQPEAIVSIGHPIANTQFYILDSHQKLVPIGVRGELHIGGAGLARGYLNRPELTAQKFIPNPFDKESRSRLYKTGDLVRYRPEGTIEFLGRIDNQVKIRGFRIELGEIEALLCQHPGVQESVVVAAKDKSGSQLLVAYVVCKPEQVLTIAQLHHLLESKLPNYMVPRTFVMLEALPLTPNGKVDRRSLPAPDLTQLKPEDNFVTPSTPVEEMLAGIWAEVLGIEVGIYDNFFELGGHSLLATRVISQVRQIFAVELPLRQLFEKPTVAELASYIEIATQAGLRLEVPPIERISRDGEIPVSFAQQRLWFLTQLEPESSFYNIPAAVRLQGQLNIEALQQSFNEILHRHEALRTNFKTVEGQPVAVISKVTSLLLPVLDISELPSNQTEADVVRQLAYFEARQPFDLDSDLLLRVKLLRLGEQEHILLLTMHHIASDGWSINVLVRELATLYQAGCLKQTSALAELPIQYADFAAWQRQWLQAEVLQSQLSYWLKQLEGAPRVLELPTDYPRPAIVTFRGARYSFELSQQLSVALNKLSKSEGVTLFMTLLAAFGTLLGRYTGSEDIVVGSPIANRTNAQIEGLIGFFVNTLVLRTNIFGNPTFKELLTRVREVALGAYVHQDLPFELLVEKLQPERDLSHTPLFQVMFVLQNAQKSALELPGLTISQIATESDSAKFDLTLYMTETEGGLVGTLEYNTDLFESSTISRMVGHLQTLLAGIVANPEQRLSELPLLTQAEKALLLQWNDTQTEYLEQQCIHQLFEAQVERTPDAVAVVFELEQLTYRELNAKANQLAHYLRSLGVGSEVLVGICTERSSGGAASLTLDMVIGLLGILKAGGAYVPLDPTYPKERLALILEDASVPVLLTQQRLVGALPQHQAKVVCLDADWFLIAQQSKENIDRDNTVDNLAYVIYTSGSTGKPKGVQIPHSALSNFLHAMRQTPELTDLDTLLAVTTISFDIAALELFLPITVGARLVVVSREIASDGTRLSALLTQSNATVMQATPATWQLLLTAGWEGNHQLKILCGGEALPRHLANQLLNRCDSLWNMYGPTETTIWSAACKVETDSSIMPIHPIANTQFYILDQHGQLVPVGVPGELHIGGDGLARGYLKRPELTAEKFIPNPFENSKFQIPNSKWNRLYKTGDIARYLPNGEIEYLGRIDYQVKVRGFRIELGEIEAHLSQHPIVRETVVVAREDAADSQQIVAYVVPQKEQILTTTELRHFLESKLPNYMIPAAFVILEALPLTPNGKVDRKALPAPDTVRPELEAVYQPPQTEIEQAIANIWQEFLHIEDVGIYDNFFELGGHSLLLVQIHSKLQKRFQRDFPLVEMFQYPTISHLARYLSQESSEQESFTQHSDRSQSRTASVQRRKQARKEHRSTKQKGVS